MDNRLFSSSGRERLVLLRLSGAQARASHDRRSARFASSRANCAEGSRSRRRLSPPRRPLLRSRRRPRLSTSRRLEASSALVRTRARGASYASEGLLGPKMLGARSAGTPIASCTPVPSWRPRATPLSDWRSPCSTTTVRPLEPQRTPRQPPSHPPPRSPLTRTFSNSLLPPILVERRGSHDSARRSRARVSPRRALRWARRSRDGSARYVVPPSLRRGRRAAGSSRRGNGLCANASCWASSLRIYERAHLLLDPVARVFPCGSRGRCITHVGGEGALGYPRDRMVRAPRPSSRRWAYWIGSSIVPFGALLSCQGGPVDEALCSMPRRGALFHGDDNDAYLGLTPARQAAVVSVQFASGDGMPTLPCSGVLVGSSWVLSARHCLPEIQPWTVTVGLGMDLLHADLVVAGADLRMPPAGKTWDAILIALARPVPTSLAEPLAPSTFSPERLLGARVLMGGYGVTDRSQVGRRQFVTEEVTGVDLEMLTVDGRGKSGACIADSGGPAIWREGEMPTVVGILHGGDANCAGVDQYTSVYALREWITANIGTDPSPQEGCGTVTAEGKCFGSKTVRQAVWCEQGVLRSSQCVGDSACGWDVSAVGYRCVPIDHDPCMGVSQLGACRVGGVLVCLGGKLTERACSGCESCTIRPANGEADCAPE